MYSYNHILLFLYKLHDAVFTSHFQSLQCNFFLLILLGVKSFKIEGRLKGPEYVAITTKAYRLAVDEAWRALHLEPGTETGTGKNSDKLKEAGDRAGKRGGGNEEMKMIMNENVNIKNLKKKISTSSSTSTSSSSTSTSSVRFNGLDEELMRDLKQVFSRGQDESYDGLSAGYGQN